MGGLEIDKLIFRALCGFCSTISADRDAQEKYWPLGVISLLYTPMTIFRSGKASNWTEDLRKLSFLFLTTAEVKSLVRAPVRISDCSAAQSSWMTATSSGSVMLKLLT